MLVLCTNPSSIYWLWLIEVLLERPTGFVDIFAEL